jgi:hypothetical protein
MLCKTHCGYEIEYEPHEFSDGFVYYLPRNVDGTVHDCFMVGEIMQDIIFQNAEEHVGLLEKTFQENNDKLNLNLNGFLENIRNTNTNFLEFIANSESMDFELMSMVREGRMFDLKKHLESKLNIASIPFFKSRESLGVVDFITDIITVSFENASYDDVCEWIHIELPTNKGYQLEYLGKFYELMIRLEDAKKCYELQYESTKEPEFPEIIKKLDEKIKETNTEKTIQNSVKNISHEDTVKLVKQTELDTREFILKIFDSNLSQVWKLLPKIKENVDYNRSEEEGGFVGINEKSLLDHTTLGELAKILTICNPKINSNKDDSCKKCNKKWKKHEKVFLIKNPNTIKCVDSDCFVSQGGIIKKNIGNQMINDLFELSRYRNNYTDAHPKEVDKTRLSIYNEKIALICKMLKIQYDEINYV